VAIFLSIGVGLASPFLIVSWVPGWSRFVPRSGPWMLKLRAGLGFALLATVVWLLWIVGSSSGSGGMTALIALLLGLAFALWLFGQVQSLGRPRLTNGGVLVVVLLALAGLGGGSSSIAGEEATRRGAHAMASEQEAWRPWRPESVSDELSRGRPVFVVFSADWCLTCKLNERVVLADDSVQSALVRLGFATFKADWTRRDEGIRRELARFGKAGVPLYLVYDPTDPDQPLVLPELLAVDGVLTALREVGTRMGSEALAVQTMNGAAR